MDNLFCIIVTGMLFATTAFLLFYIVKRRGEEIFSLGYVAFFALLLLWGAVEIATFTVTNAAALRLLCELRLSVVALVFATFFLAAKAVYGLDRRLSPRICAALFAPPAASSAVSVIFFNTKLVTSEFTVLSFSPLVDVRMSRGVWFYVMAAYVLALIVLIITTISAERRARPKAYRYESALFAVSFALLAAGAALTALYPVGRFYAYFPATLSGMFLYLTIELSGRSSFLQIERSDVFDYLETAVLLLGPDGSIIDMNRPARKLTEFFGVRADGQKLDDYLAGLLTDGIILRKVEHAATTDFYFSNASYPLIYRMYRQEVPAQGTSAAWAFASFEDVTRNQLLVERLQAMAGVDALTGLLNRYGYTELLRKLDRPENLPISIIMGDVNGLKQINDDFGHVAGDRMLAAVASAIKGCCDCNSHAARIGGDEFVVLAQNCDEEQGAKLLEKLSVAVAGIEGFEQAPGIALGCATKNHPNENINSLLNRADRLMYSEKK